MAVAMRSLRPLGPCRLEGVRLLGSEPPRAWGTEVMWNSPSCSESESERLQGSPKWLRSFCFSWRLNLINTSGAVAECTETRVPPPLPATPRQATHPPTPSGAWGSQSQGGGLIGTWGSSWSLESMGSEPGSPKLAGVRTGYGPGLRATKRQKKRQFKGLTQALGRARHPQWSSSRASSVWAHFTDEETEAPGGEDTRSSQSRELIPDVLTSRQ